METAYGKQPNFITYDDGNSHIYSYNANIGTGGNGELDSPVILVAGEDDLEGIFVLSYCSSGSYILNEPKSDPYQKATPAIKRDWDSTCNTRYSTSFRYFYRHNQSAVFYARIVWGTIRDSVGGTDRTDPFQCQIVL